VKLENVIDKYYMNDIATNSYTGMFIYMYMCKKRCYFFFAII